MNAQEKWLTLGQAAKELGVHSTTLRRWADKGEIRVMLTPGGHRRFAAADVVRFAEERRRLRTVTGLEQIWADQALQHTRQEIVNRRHEGWLAVFDEEDRERKRELGRRLLGLMLQYISSDTGDEDVLREARAIGHLHAENALSFRLPLVEAMEAVLFFRDSLVEVAIQLPEIAQIQPEGNLRLLRRINTLLNSVQLAIADVYDRASR